MSEHSRVGGSAAYRFMECTASVQHMIDNPMPSTLFADEGTKAHDLAEKLMTEPDNVNMSDYPTDMIEYIQGYIKYIQDVYEGVEDDPKMNIERKVCISSIDKECHGTADCLIFTELGELHVIDLKYGHRHVEAEDNKQLMYYALAAIDTLDIEPTKVVVHIYQPRTAYDPGRFWEVPMKTLKAFKKDLTHAVKKVKSGKTKFLPGSHCLYCNKAQCPAVKEKIEKEAMIAFSDIEQIKPDVSKLSNEQLLRIKKLEPLMTGIIKDANLLMLQRAEAGDKFNGMKLIKSYGNRAWKKGVKPEDLMEEYGLPEEAVFEAKAKSVAQVEKAIKQVADKEGLTKFEGFTTRPERGLKLVDEHDPGQEVNPGFTNIE